jgi:hypothetical protein
MQTQRPLTEAEYGGEVGPKPPQQEMHEIDVLAGGPVEDRKASPAIFTGGDKEAGLGGEANPPEPGGIFHERIGF